MLDGGAGRTPSSAARSRVRKTGCLPAPAGNTPLHPHFRSSRKCGWSGVLPAGAGRQPVFRTRDRAALLGVLPAPPSSMTPSGQEASFLIDTITNGPALTQHATALFVTF